MPLHLLPIDSLTEIPTLARIHLEAFMLVRVNQAMYPLGLTPPIIAATEARHRNTLLNDPTARYVKVVDTDLDGKTIAFAEWHLFSTPEEEASRLDLGVKTWPADVNLPLMEEFWDQIIRARKTMAGIPHVFLSIIATDPGQGRRGAGKILMEFGIGLANERGLPCFLESSPHGKGLYGKFGFVEREKLTFEVGLGAGEVYRHLVMVRPAGERGQ